MSAQVLRIVKKESNKSENFSRFVSKETHLGRSDTQVKYKTELCRNLESGFCEFGEKCYFAHSLEELRDKVQVNSMKHLKCNDFFEQGYCLYGSKCQYLHKDVFPETAESSPNVSNKNSRKASRDVVRVQRFIDLETRDYF